MEERRCAGCGDPLALNPRSRSTHLWCRRAACQRERRARTQRERRADEERQQQAESLTKAQRRKRAAYMRVYRAEHAKYRVREAVARRDRRRGDFGERRNEAGSSERAQAIYVEATEGGARRLRLVTEAGSVVTVAFEGDLELSGVERRNEAS